MTRAVVIAVLCAAGLAAEPRAQNPEAAARNPTGATLSGRVVADATGAPVANARIVISAAGHGSTIAVSDRDGVFTFAPPDPSFALVAAKSGYVQARMTSGAAASDVVLRLVRSCVVSGRVIDASGEPVVDAMIAVSEAPAGQGPTRPLARGDTDDAGDFRIAGIAPGAVVVSVTTASGMEVTRTLANQILASPRIATVFYPRATTKAEADVIALEPGDERSDVDFVVAADQGGLNAITSSFYVMPKPRTAGGTSTIGGRVFATDGRPVAAAYVRLLGATGFTPVASARTDAAGRFAFADLDAGRYRVAAGKPGFTAADAAEAGMPAPPPYGFSPWIDLKADESRDRIDLQLVRLGSVSGVLFDETGEPVQGASVQLLRVRFDRGRRRLVGVGPARPTDDRGRYRIGGVAAGRYVVGATVGAVNGADLPGYAPAYFPGTIDAASAQFVSVAAAQDVTGVDFPLTPTRTALVSGTVLDPSGTPTFPGMLQLRSTSASPVSVAVNARIDRDGTFEFRNVTPGPWILYADRGRKNPSVEGEFAAMPIVVTGEDLTDVKLQLSAGSSIAGRIRFEGNTDRLPGAGAITIVAAAVDPDLSPGNVAEAAIERDWSFHVTGVNGMRRLVATRLPDGWALRQVRVNGIDVGDRPIAFGRVDQSLPDVEVVLTDRVSAVAGTVTAGDRPSPTVPVIAMPIDRERRYAASPFLKQGTTDADGRFVIAVPPGTYYVTAASAVPSGGVDAWQDPEFLESLVAWATTVTVGEGQTQTVTLRMR